MLPQNPHPDSGSPRASGESRGRVLYIEDNQINIMIVSEVLSMKPGLTLESAPDGSTGVSKALETQPDLVLVDMQLPDIDGREVLRRLRADPRGARLRCIALSANAMPEEIDRALREGFDEYWTKPLDVPGVLASLDTIFG